MTYTPTPIRSKAGVLRDGTVLEGDYYIDSQWCRFYRGLPRKILGYGGVTSALPELTRGMSSFSSDALQYLHMGSASALTQIVVGPTGVFQSQAARVPGAGFVSSSDNLWQFDVFQDPITAAQTLIAHPGRNLSDIDNTATSKIFIGDVTGSGVLTDSGIDPVSGGICIIAPYLFTFGSKGELTWSAPGTITDFDSVGSNDEFATGQKIVKGLPLRNGSGGPAGIFWSLDSVIRAISTSDANAGFAVDTLSSESSILSSQGVIEYDGVFFWAGVDRFLMFNGVVQEVPNTMNLDWFFDHLNFAQRQKVFAFKVPRRGEIWWCYPRGNATECTHAVIFNVREQTWYDTQLPRSGRSAGVFAKVYQKPFMVDVDLTGTGYTLWQHETGLDEINGSTVNAIPSYFETNEISLTKQQQPSTKALTVAFIEPDFNQTGDMSVTIKGRANARAPVLSANSVTFNQYSSEVPVTLPPDEQILGVKATRRLLRFRFESNVAGGNYFAGESYAHIEPSDGRITT